MKFSSRWRAATLLCLILIGSYAAHRSPVFAQGSLFPPGTPSPTMKTLAQIQARTPISSAPYTISASGSYYLTNNLTVTSGDAIVINANGVTLDLNGFSITSSSPYTVPGSGSAISVPLAYQNIRILNGSVTSGLTFNGAYNFSGGFANGISAAAAPGVHVNGISICGCHDNGILAGENSIVESCAVRTVMLTGISAMVVAHSVASQCGGAAIAAGSIENSRGDSVASFNGIDASQTAMNCYGSSADGAGVHSLAATNCYGLSTTGDGVVASTARNGFGSSTSGRGIFADAAINCRGQSSSNDGIDAKTATNCYGTTAGGTALSAQNATNSTGSATGPNSVGLNVVYSAHNCTGITGSQGFAALSAVLAQNCFGDNASGPYGLKATMVFNSYGHDGTSSGLATTFATNSKGVTESTASGIASDVAFGCAGQVYARVEATSCVQADTPHKHDMP